MRATPEASARAPIETTLRGPLRAIILPIFTDSKAPITKDAVTPVDTVLTENPR